MSFNLRRWSDSSREGIVMADELSECQLRVLGQFPLVGVPSAGSGSSVLKNDAIPRLGSVARRRIAFDGL